MAAAITAALAASLEKKTRLSLYNKRRSGNEEEWKTNNEGGKQARRRKKVAKGHSRGAPSVVICLSWSFELVDIFRRYIVHYHRRWRTPSCYRVGWSFLREQAFATVDIVAWRLVTGGRRRAGLICLRRWRLPSYLLTVCIPIQYLRQFLSVVRLNDSFTFSVCRTIFYGGIVIPCGRAMKISWRLEGAASAAGGAPGRHMIDHISALM